MCWKYSFDVVTFTSSFDEELADPGAVSPAFASVFRRSSVSAGMGIRLVSVRSPFAVIRPSSMIALASTSKPPFLDLVVEHHALILEHLEDQGLCDRFHRAGDSPNSIRIRPLSRSVACMLRVTPFTDVSTLVSTSRSISLPARLSARCSRSRIMPAREQVSEVERGNHVILAMRKRDRIPEIIRHLRLVRDAWPSAASVPGPAGWPGSTRPGEKWGEGTCWPSTVSNPLPLLARYEKGRTRSRESSGIRRRKLRRQHASAPSSIGKLERPASGRMSCRACFSPHIALKHHSLEMSKRSPTVS